MVRGHRGSFWAENVAKHPNQKKLTGYRRNSTPPSRPKLFQVSFRFFSKVIEQNVIGQIFPDGPYHRNSRCEPELLAVATSSLCMRSQTLLVSQECAPCESGPVAIPGVHHGAEKHARSCANGPRRRIAQKAPPHRLETVSYTHLTLPTIPLV